MRDQSNLPGAGWICSQSTRTALPTGPKAGFRLRQSVLPLSDMAYLVNNTLGSNLFALLIILSAGWIRMRSNQMRKVGPLTVPSEIVYIIPSGICTAVVIPTTTLMYSLPMSVMVGLLENAEGIFNGDFGSLGGIGEAIDAIDSRKVRRICRAALHYLHAHGALERRVRFDVVLVEPPDIRHIPGAFDYIK